jgi:hypothetical protein
MNAMLAMLVLAQRYTGRVRGIRDSFGDGDSGGGAGNLVLLLVSAAIVLVIALAWHHARKGGRPLHSAMKLFRESVESLGLTREEKYLVERMVRELRLPEPARLLLDAGTFDQSADKMVARAPKDKRSYLTEALTKIRDKVFSHKR